MSDYDRIANLVDENTKLRSIVNALADGLNHELEIGCVRCMEAHSSNKCPHAACDRNENRALVVKAREAVSKMETTTEVANV